ncbi:hypothetical protein HNQ07_004009 [Deinococcus metalli]|uniref:DDE domain-containing protein n=1 Tax=Deinococcus metalli TaxID=1141878 RepID=A0A7W8NTS0_9DEIO|nr:hypothetical protein [Deinococcus metalli]
MQAHRDTEAASSFFQRLLGEYDVPEVIHTEKLRRHGAALRERPVLHSVEHVQVVSTARCNTLIEQSHRPARQQERQQRGFRSRKRAHGVLDLHARITNLHNPARSTVSARHRRRQQHTAFESWRGVVQQVACISGHLLYRGHSLPAGHNHSAETLCPPPDADPSQVLRLLSPSLQKTVLLKLPEDVDALTRAARSFQAEVTRCALNDLSVRSCPTPWP